jgi:metal-dependent amidase/aminoacylase/carboxypeptidase family protein
MQDRAFESADSEQQLLGLDSEYTTPSSIDQSYRKYELDLRQISLKIYEYCELAYEEHKSAALLSGFLQNEGFTIEREIAGRATAFTATYVQNGGPVVSFNAVPLLSLF